MPLADPSLILLKLLGVMSILKSVGDFVRIVNCVQIRLKRLILFIKTATLHIRIASNLKY